MYYVREVVDGTWKTFKLSEDEVSKLQRVTAKRVMKAIATVKDEIAKAATGETPITFTPAETLVIVQKVAPSYEDTVHDWIRKQTWKGAVPATAAAPAAAPTPEPAAPK